MKKKREDGYGILSSILSTKSRYCEFHVPYNQKKPEDTTIAKTKSATAKIYKRHNEQSNIKGKSRVTVTSTKEYFVTLVKVQFSPSKNFFFFICFIESLLKMMKIAFCFILKAPFCLDILVM